MKKILLYIVSILILVACSDEIPEHHQPVRAKRAVLAYMVANNNLDGLYYAKYTMDVRKSFYSQG